MRRSVVLMACMLASGAYAQSLERSVIGSAGTFEFQAPTGSLSFTVGEAATSTLVGPANTLTQGFQQPDDDFSTVVASSNLPPDIAVFPNPVADLLFCRDEAQRPLSFTFSDAAGRVLHVDVNALGNTRGFDVRSLAPGPYWITITCAVGGRWCSTFIKR